MNGENPKGVRFTILSKAFLLWNTLQQSRWDVVVFPKSPLTSRKFGD